MPLRKKTTTLNMKTQYVVELALQIAIRNYGCHDFRTFRSIIVGIPAILVEGCPLTFIDRCLLGVAAWPEALPEVQKSRFSLR